MRHSVDIVKPIIYFRAHLNFRRKSKTQNSGYPHCASCGGQTASCQETCAVRASHPGNDGRIRNPQDLDTLQNRRLDSRLRMTAYFCSWNTAQESPETTAETLPTAILFLEACNESNALTHTQSREHQIQNFHSGPRFIINTPTRCPCPPLLLPLRRPPSLAVVSFSSPSLPSRPW